MPIVDIQISKDDFNSSGWEAIIQQCGEKDCHDYSRLLLAKAKEAKDAGETKTAAVFRLMGQVASMMLRPGSTEKPFAPVMEWGDSRSAVVDDLSDEELDALAEIISDITDSEMRARIADVLWLRKSDYHFAETAIDSYLGSAKVLEHPEHLTACEDRIERALRLATSLGTNGKKFKLVISHIEHVLDKYHGENPLYLSDKFMRLLLEFEQGDATKYSELSEKLAKRAETNGNMELARSCWETNAKWHKKAGDSKKEETARIKGAETYVQSAEAAMDRSNRIAGSLHMRRAIEAYRRISGTKERREQLHRRLLEIQRDIPKDLEVVSSEVDLSGAVKEAVAKVKGKSLPEAIASLVVMARSSEIALLRDEVEKAAKEFPLQHIVPAMKVDEAGKVIAQIPSLLSGDQNEIEAAKKARMYQQAQFHQQIYTAGIIEPVRAQIRFEHRPQLMELMPIVSNNPLIPDGRESIYAHGLLSGFNGDFLVATHLLIPQFENSVRILLARRGVKTSRINDEGLQEEYDLNTTLRMDQTVEIFGGNTTFDLQGLLVERTGANLRNRMAHGLMGKAEFNSVYTVYLWWLILRLCCLPLIRVVDGAEAESSQLTDPPEPSSEE